MERTSLAARYDRLEVRQAELRAKIAKPAQPIHRETVRVLTDLLTMGEQMSSSKVPAPLRTLVRTLRHMEPMLVEELGSVPPEAVASFMGELRDRLDSIVQAAGGNSNGAGPTA